MLKEFRTLINKSLQGWTKDNNLDSLPEHALDTPPAHVSGDLSSNLALLLAPVLGRKPRDVAEELARRIDCPEMAKIEIAGPGFVNFTIKDEILSSNLKRILDEGKEYGRADTTEEKQQRGNVLIEFVSANPTGPLHVGHGRGAALGDSLSRMFRRLGYDVTAEYYVNDVGNQMDMLGLSVEARYKELKGEPAALPENGYKGDYIKEIAKSYLEGKAGTPFKEFALKYLCSTIKDDLGRFGITFDNWYYESSLFQNGLVDKYISSLRSLGLIYEQDNATWFAATKFGDEKDRVIRRADERHTYFASDIAYHADKFNRGFSRLINIWGADHHGYAPRLGAAMSALGFDPGRLTILLYQLVSLVRAGVPVAMSTRSGEFVPLEDVIKEVGADACRFFFALRSPLAQLEFDLELAKKQAPENPVYYVQYVHARCESIFREAEKRGMAPSPSFPQKLEKEERELLLKLAFFPDTVETCVHDLSPHHMTNYLILLTRTFHKFYELHRVLGEDPQLTGFRLSLVAAVRTVIASGLGLLGVSAPERM